MKKIVALAVSALVVLAITCTQYVHRGYVGVTESRGAIRMMDHGLHFKAPWHRVTFYPVRTGAVTVRSSQVGSHGKTEFDLTLHLSVQRDSVPALHTGYRGRYLEALVVPLVNDFLESHAGVGSVSFSFGPRAAALGKEIETLLNSALASHGIAVMGTELRYCEIVRSPGQ